MSWLSKAERNKRTKIAEINGLVWGGRFGVKQADYATKTGWDAGHIEYGK